jgi:hypothetical protein
MESYQLLANAIVAQAAEDYRSALIMQHAVSRCGTSEDIAYYDKEVEKLEHWFAGRCALFTRLDGAELARMIKTEVIKFDYDQEAIRKSHI